MKNYICNTVLLLISVVLITILPTRQATAETLIGTNNDSRIVLALKVDEKPVQSMLPDGWTLVPFPGGPLTGANTIVVFVDRYLAQDAEGKPSNPASYRGVALASLAKSDSSDEVRTFVTKIFAAADGYDPYANATAAKISRNASVESHGANAPKRSENWSVAAQGGELTFTLSYLGGTPSWSSGEARPYSNTKPDFFRIYRFDQLVEVAMSEPLGKTLEGDAAFASSIPDLADIFDGTEQMVAVIVVPMYIRSVFLP